MNKKGFTLLIGVLIVIGVIGIIAILLTIVFVALSPVNPAKRFVDARNSQRWKDVNNILTAVDECIVDNDGFLTDCGLSTSLAETQLGTAVSGCDGDNCGVIADCLDLSAYLIFRSYPGTIPVDPGLARTSTKTHYSIAVDANNIITITACDAEEGETIQVSR